MSALAARMRRGRWLDVAVPFVVIHVLSAAAWALATITTRRLRGDDYRAPQFSGVFGWMSWDAGFYRRIAVLGYPSTEVEALRFFPLYPGTAKVARSVGVTNTDLVLLVVAKLALVVALIGLVRLVRRELGRTTLATTSVWVLVLFPGSFVLTWGYSESLLLALCIWAFLALRSGRFAWAAVAGFAAGCCRPVGIALVVAAAIEGARGFGRADRRGRAARVAATVAPLLGMATFLVYSALAHDDAWLPISIQDEFRNNADPLSRLIDLPSQVFGTEALKAGLHAPFAVVFVAVLVLVFRRLPASYGAFSAFILAMALSAENLNSLERYAMSAFPLSIVVAELIDRDDGVRSGALAVGGALFVGLATLALCGAYVP